MKKVKKIAAGVNSGKKDYLEIAVKIATILLTVIETARFILDYIAK